MSGDLRRVLILGPPGSGKSTLACRIGAKHRLPVFHLDQAYWRPGWVAVTTETFHAEVARIADLPAWIIDGNYTDTIAPRLAAADTLIYLDVSSHVSLLRILKRTLAHHGRVRSDAAAGCPERLDLDFLHFAWAWNRTRRARSLSIAKDFEGRTIVLRGRQAVERFLTEA